MSKATKRKYVTKEVLENYFVPEEPAYIVKVIAGRGNNLHEVESPDGERYLASMPTKFRKNVWIKRGDFVVVEPIKEGDKVKAEIIQILLKDQIKYIKSEGKWPVRFEDKKVKDETENEDALFFNPNRKNDDCSSDSDSDSSGSSGSSQPSSEEESDAESSEN